MFELHGNMFEVECIGCAARTTMREALGRVAAGELDSASPDCGGILKSATIMFGQELDPQVLGAAEPAV